MRETSRLRVQRDDKDNITGVILTHDSRTLRISTGCKEGQILKRIFEENNDEVERKLIEEEGEDPDVMDLVPDDTMKVVFEVLTE